MKKAVKLLSVLLLGMLVSMPVYAEAEADVWHETDVEGNNLSVSIETNGKATDGVISIGYKSSLIDCTEDDVKVDKSVVDMYSVNVIDGSVRISFLAEGAIEAGTFAEIVFNVVDENADEETLKSAITFQGEAYAENGTAVVVANTQDPEPTAEPTGTPEPTAGPTGDPEPTAEPTGTPDPSAEPTESPEPTTEPTETPGNSGGGNGPQDVSDTNNGNGSASGTAQGANTGDDTDISAYLILSLVTGGLLLAFAVRRALAAAGRRLNH